MAEEDLPTELRVLTLNCWGLKYISKLRPQRLSEIGRRIASDPDPPHIVALQECWVMSDYDAVRAATSAVLPHAKFYHSGPFGAGLAILSRWPIDESSMLPYPLNGRPTAFWRGDWFVGKGVACARIRARLASGPDRQPRDHIVTVLNTHTHAPYTENQPGDTYLCHRLSQSWEISKLLRSAAASATAESGHLVLALGDFNMRPLSLPYRIITAHAPVRDAWRVLRPDSSLGAADDPLEKARGRPAPTAEFNLLENGATSDGVYNTWRWPAEQQKRLGEGRDPVVVSPDTVDRKGKRLDYIFFGPAPSSENSARSEGCWVVRSAKVGMVEPHPTLGCSLSDHFSVEATFAFQVPGDGSIKEDNEVRISSSSSSRSSISNPKPTKKPNLPDSPGISAKDSQPSPQDSHLPIAAYDEILAVTRLYAQREEKQRYWRGLHFFAWLAVLAGCLVAVWFTPGRDLVVAFVLLLLSSLGMVAGVVDGLLSLLFFNSELRALKEFEWEVTNAKNKASAAASANAVERGEIKVA